MQWKTTAGITALFLALSGCATSMEGPGAYPAETPPKLIEKGEHPTWNDPGLFGPVPAELQAMGDEVCQSDNYRHAIGYHPEARDINGSPIPGGGFLCVDELAPDTT
ncbi:MAG: hypothetical protein U5L98_07760 [Halomonas sp.]|uniref:hypothetical protein n=1 Tax=Halomonas sp. TaxID=1486246 RepID=UPI002ACE944D|nr:hypothetical protein [Halomonas sp.]MDZ7852534.1 hypothetical protein [Halomonas sp.]